MGSTLLQNDCWWTGHSHTTHSVGCGTDIPETPMTFVEAKFIDTRSGTNTAAVYICRAAPLLDVSTERYCI